MLHCICLLQFVFKVHFWLCYSSPSSVHTIPSILLYNNNCIILLTALSESVYLCIVLRVLCHAHELSTLCSSHVVSVGNWYSPATSPVCCSHQRSPSSTDVATTSDSQSDADDNAIAGREYISFRKNRALCDNFLKLCMVLGTDMTFSKTTAHKLRETPSGRYAQNPRWPPLETERAISLLILKAEPIVIPLF